MKTDKLLKAYKVLICLTWPFLLAVSVALVIVLTLQMWI